MIIYTFILAIDIEFNPEAEEFVRTHVMCVLVVNAR